MHVMAPVLNTSHYKRDQEIVENFSGLPFEDNFGGKWKEILARMSSDQA